MRVKRYQSGSLQRRKSGKVWKWVALWREGNSRRFKTLGRCCEMTQGEARKELNKILLPVNNGADFVSCNNFTFDRLVSEIYFPFCRGGKWKLSTAETTEQRIRTHLLAAFGELPCRSLTRSHLQKLLDEKACQGLSFSVVDHLRWDLRAIFKIAVEDNILDRNPADSLFTPRCINRAGRRVMTGMEVIKCSAVLEAREKLIARLAIIAGMRPSEILGLQWGHIQGNVINVRQRLYRGKLDKPKTDKSVRDVALAPLLVKELQHWRDLSLDTTEDAWVFPSERLITAISKENCWYRHMMPKLRQVGLEWANFQVMRRTHSSSSRELGIDPKLVADQMGHGLGVNLDVYTQTRIASRLEAVKLLESKFVQ